MYAPFYLDPRYTVDSDGNIYGLKGQPLKLAKNHSGYLFFNFWLNGKRKTHVVHRAIIKSFIPQPSDLPFVNHKDGNKLNNSLSNLEYCTGKYNTIHARDVLHLEFGNKRAVVAYNVKTNERFWFKSLSECAKKLQVSVPSICRVAKGNRPTVKGFKIFYQQGC